MEDMRRDKPTQDPENMKNMNDVLANCVSMYIGYYKNIIKGLNKKFFIKYNNKQSEDYFLATTLPTQQYS
eukprot:2179753-Amphidinium_carterae.1